MSDEIVIFNRGAIVQQGDPRTLYDAPASHFVAGFLGRSNFIEGEVEACDNGSLLYRVGEHRLRQATASPPPGQGRVLIGLRPEKMQIASEAPKQGNALPATVKNATYLGADQHLELDSPVGAITVRVPGWPAVTPAVGERVWAVWEADASTILKDDRAAT